MNSYEQAAWQALEESMVYYRNKPVGTIAACDDGRNTLNYDQVFTRDFAVSAIAFMCRGDYDIVRNFLLVMVELQQTERHMDCFYPGKGMMPASFKIVQDSAGERLLGDFGEHAIGRVTPIDSGFWWIYVLYAYTRASGDTGFAQREDVQHAMRLILDLCLPSRHEMLPTLLVPDGAFMIDRRLGVYGHPLEIQSLLHFALRASVFLLDDGSESSMVNAAMDREKHLAYHLRTYYWLDFERLNHIYRYRVEEFGENVVNQFNIYPSDIPPWIFDWMPATGGYFAGNLGPGRMDYRFFTQGNLLAIMAGLADVRQAQLLMQFYETNWEDLMGTTPVKLVFPALEGRDWQIVTGSDPKNSAWSYHNGGNWPFLIWLFVAAALKCDRRDLAERALALTEAHVLNDNWPEYYDGRYGRLVGKEAKLQQTWSIASYLAATSLMANPNALAALTFDTVSKTAACDA
jgi:hypothetical protein